jgi:hypothetical protein
VKYSCNPKARHTFRFSAKQRKGLDTDILVIICDDGIKPTFHFFKVKEFLADGVPNTLAYIRDAKQRRPNRKALLNPSIMAASQDRISLIDEHVSEVRQRLLNAAKTQTLSNAA